MMFKDKIYLKVCHYRFFLNQGPCGKQKKINQILGRVPNLSKGAAGSGKWSLAAYSPFPSAECNIC